MTFLITLCILAFSLDQVLFGCDALLHDDIIPIHDHIQLDSFSHDLRELGPGDEVLMDAIMLHRHTRLGMDNHRILMRNRLEDEDDDDDDDDSDNDMLSTTSSSDSSSHSAGLSSSSSSSMESTIDISPTGSSTMDMNSMLDDTSSIDSSTMISSTVELSSSSSSVGFSTMDNASTDSSTMGSPTMDSSSSTSSMVSSTIDDASTDFSTMESSTVDLSSSASSLGTSTVDSLTTSKSSSTSALSFIPATDYRNGLCLNRAIPPSDGEGCGPNPKTCYFGFQMCFSLMDFPTVKCDCVDRIWTCQKEICPIEDFSASDSPTVEAPTTQSSSSSTTNPVTPNSSSTVSASSSTSSSSVDKSSSIAIISTSTLSLSTDASTVGVTTNATTSDIATGESSDSTSFLASSTGAVTVDATTPIASSTVHVAKTADALTSIQNGRCSSRPVPPLEGEVCSAKPKTCFFGAQSCLSVFDYPKLKCDCADQSWSCAMVKCPTCPLTQPSDGDSCNEEGLTCNFGVVEQCCGNLFISMTCSCSSGEWSCSERGNCVAPPCIGDTWDVVGQTCAMAREQILSAYPGMKVECVLLEELTVMTIFDVNSVRIVVNDNNLVILPPRVG